MSWSRPSSASGPTASIARTNTWTELQSKEKHRERTFCPHPGAGGTIQLAPRLACGSAGDGNLSRPERQDFPRPKGDHTMKLLQPLQPPPLSPRVSAGLLV